MSPQHTPPRGWPHHELCRNSGTHTDPNTHTDADAHTATYSPELREREREREKASLPCWEVLHSSVRLIHRSLWSVRVTGSWDSCGWNITSASLRSLHALLRLIFLSWWFHPSHKLLVPLPILTSVLISDKFCCGKVCDRILTSPAFDPPLPRFSSSVTPKVGTEHDPSFIILV